MFNFIEIQDEYLKLTIQGLRNNLEYVSVVAKDVDSFNKNEEHPNALTDFLIMFVHKCQTKNLADSIQ
jgi:hypothetical protein